MQFITKAYALTSNIDKEVKSFFKFHNLGTFVQNLIQIIVIAGSISTFLYLLWGGIEFITSSGDQEKTKKAKNKISSAIMGLVIVATAWIIWRLVMYFLGLSPSTTGTFEIPLPSP